MFPGQHISTRPMMFLGKSGNQRTSRRFDITLCLLWTFEMVMLFIQELLTVQSVVDISNGLTHSSTIKYIHVVILFHIMT